MPTKTLSRQAPKVKNMPAIHSYNELRDAVKAELLRGHERMEAERIRTYWEVGRLINKFILDGDGRAEFGKRIVLRLARDLEMSRTALYQAVRFAKAYPIVHLGGQLTWSHYRALAFVAGKKERKALEDQVMKSGWTKEDLEAHIKSARLEKQDASEHRQKALPLLEAPELGNLYTYRVVGAEKIKPDEGSLWLDLGFANYRKLGTEERKGLSAGDIVTAFEEGSGVYRFQKETKLDSSETEKTENTGAELLYTYKAFVERVVDGDTLRVQIDLGFNHRLRQYLRLRGIDAPEIHTPQGRRAKGFVERKLKKMPFIIFKSHRAEKYDRYLADVFYGKDHYLNQELLNAAFANRA